MSADHTIGNGQITVGLTGFGGTLTSVKGPDGSEYLWQGDATYWSGQAPILFPICGSIRGDHAVTRDGHELSMPRHGIVRKREWELEEAGDSSACYVFRSDDKTLAAYPYPFELRSRYSVEGPTLTVTYEVTNTGDVAMPFQIGGHPGFRCPFIEGDSYDDCYLEFEREERCSAPEPVTETGLIEIGTRHPVLEGTNVLPLDHSLFHKDAQILDELASRVVRLRSRNSERGIEVEFEDLPYLIVWSTSNDGPFVALEPWVGLSTCDDEDDVFESKRNVQVASPGQTRSYSFAVSVL